MRKFLIALSVLLSLPVVLFLTTWLLPRPTDTTPAWVFEGDGTEIDYCELPVPASVRDAILAHWQAAMEVFDFVGMFGTPGSIRVEGDEATVGDAHDVDLLDSQVIEDGRQVMAEVGDEVGLVGARRLPLPQVVVEQHVVLAQELAQEERLGDAES